MAIHTSEVTVLGSVCRRAPNGKYQIFLQVQTRPGAPIAYVKGAIAQAPLPGTRVRVTGNVTTTPHGPLVQLKSDADLVYMSCNQGVLLRDLVSLLLDRFDIQYDNIKLETQCFNAGHELVSIDRSSFIQLLQSSGVQNAESIVNERESLFASTLTKGFLDGLERIKIPYLPDLKRETPFKMDMWPSDVLRGFSPDYMKISHGQEPHAGLGKKIYITDFIKHEGIDNFYRSLAIYMNDPSIFSSWIQENKRPSTIASAFIKDKQKEGVQIFDNSSFKQLERFGIAHAGKTLSRLGQMYQINTGDTKDALVSQGAYQSSSRIATLDKLSDHVPKLNVKVNNEGLDAEQKEALQQFCDGVSLLLVSGPAGTGKSTLTARMINHAVEAGEAVAVLTLPSKAAARLNVSLEAEDMGFDTPEARTIHSLFYRHGDGTSFKRVHLNTIKPALDSAAVHSFPVRVDRVLNSATFMNGKIKDLKLQNTLLEEMLPPAILTGVTVFLDESSQITSDILALIFEMRPKRVVMVGDYGQLRPVGAGRPFHDLIKLYENGKLHNKLSYVELKTDHRATKELSVFTSRIRNGELPLDSVTSYDSDMDTPTTIVDHLFHKEGAIIECRKDVDSINMVEALYNKDITTNSPFFTFSYTNTPTITDIDAINIQVPCKLTKALSVSRTVLPDIMLMSSTNVAVNGLCDKVKSILRPNIVSSHSIKNVPLFSNFVANDHIPGEIIMQTSNANRRIGYTTPEGASISSKTMNGETYLFLGANVWLPLPSQSNLKDIEFAVNNAWDKSGLLAKAKSISSVDSDSHFQLYDELVKLAANNNEGAKTLLSMALGELLMIPQHALKSLKIPAGGSIVCADSRIQRIPVLPEKPFSINNGIVNDSGSMGLIHDVWKINEVYGKKKKYGLGNIEYPHYISLVEESARMQSTFVSGNAFTGHKAQGGQANMAISVVIPPINDADSSNHEEGVYTGVTRAEKKSFIIVQDKTAFELNKIWQNTRNIEENRFSLIGSIADGNLTPLCDTLRMSSVATPYCDKYTLKSSNVESMDFRKRVAISSMGVPSEVNPLKPGHGISDLLSSLYPNNVTDIGSTVFPDSGRLASLELTPSILAKKRHFKWVKNNEFTHTQKDPELDSLLSDVLIDLSFDNF